MEILLKEKINGSEFMCMVLGKTFLFFYISFFTKSIGETEGDHVVGHRTKNLLSSITSNVYQHVGIREGTTIRITTISIILQRNKKT